MKGSGFCILTILVLCFGCGQNDDLTKEELISREIEKRVRNFRISKARECREESLEIAIRQTDSLLKLNAVRYREDSLVRPPLPPKPIVSLKPAPKDSVINQPFLNRKRDTIKQDSSEKIIE